MLNNHAAPRIIAILSEDEPGVLERIAGTIRRRGCNIQSLTVGLSEEKGFSRFTVLVEAGTGIVGMITNQIEKLIPVISAEDITEQDLIKEELALIKAFDTEEVRKKIETLASMFAADVKIRDISKGRIVFRIVGDTPLIESFCDVLGHEHIEVVKRTGTTAILKGEAPEKFKTPPLA